LHVVQRWLFRYIIAYAASLAILVYLRSEKDAAVFPTDGRPVPLRIFWLLPHAILLILFAWATWLLGSGPSSFALLAVVRPICALAAAATLFAALAPGRFWLDILRRSGALPVYALLPAMGALLAYQAGQLLWKPAAALTFRLVRLLLRPIYPSLGSDPITHTVMAGDFAVQITEACSGLEGVGLMLVFCTGWLWYFRREYIFPRALSIVPAALLLIFVLNAARIAALVIIGSAGYVQIAMVGFHSQAGWIAFNLAALVVAVVAKRSSWLNRSQHEIGGEARTQDGDPTAAYLVPLLAILASGMIAHALSAGFDFLYPLRLVCAVFALWVFRRSYRALDWRCSWRGVLVGAAIFGAWIAFARLITAPRTVPVQLTGVGEPLRAGWIACRALAAVISVPIAEELAYRGFLMRRIAGRDFSRLPFQSVGWPAVSISALAFGVTHGAMWIPGCIAGAAYGVLAVKTGKIGESVVAHATTNSLIAIEVLLFGQWQLW
jgi:exosortase E/protease (VPEID-CTERM system)